MKATGTIIEKSDIKTGGNNNEFRTQGVYLDCSGVHEPSGTVIKNTLYLTFENDMIAYLEKFKAGDKVSIIHGIQGRFYEVDENGQKVRKHYQGLPALSIEAV